MRHAFIVPLLVAISAPYAILANLGSSAGAASSVSEFGGCGAENVSLDGLRASLEPKSLEFRSKDSELAPECPTECDSEVWTWKLCLKVTADPLACKLFTHGVTVYYCTGGTYYNCDGFSWVDTSLFCANIPRPGQPDCSSISPESLPVGCVPPVLSSWIYCD